MASSSIHQKMSTVSENGTCSGMFCLGCCAIQHATRRRSVPTIQMSITKSRTMPNPLYHEFCENSLPSCRCSANILADCLKSSPLYRQQESERWGQAISCYQEMMSNRDQCCTSPPNSPVNLGTFRKMSISGASSSACASPPRDGDSMCAMNSLSGSLMGSLESSFSSYRQHQVGYAMEQPSPEKSGTRKSYKLYDDFSGYPMLTTARLTIPELWINPDHLPVPESLLSAHSPRSPYSPLHWGHTPRRCVHCIKFITRHLYSSTTLTSSYEPSVSSIDENSYIGSFPSLTKVSSKNRSLHGTNPQSRGDSSLELEAIAAVHELSFAVETISVSEILPRTPDLIFVNVTTVEGHPYCLELTLKGWRVTSVRHDCMQGDFTRLDLFTTYYASLYELMDWLSPGYRDRFSEKLAQKLRMLQAGEESDLVAPAPSYATTPQVMSDGSEADTPLCCRAAPRSMHTANDSEDDQSS